MAEMRGKRKAGWGDKDDMLVGSIIYWENDENPTSQPPH